MALLRPVIEPRTRVPRLAAGLVLLGVGTALMVAADLGLPPWSVLDQGISERTGIPIGTGQHPRRRARAVRVGAAPGASRSRHGAQHLIIGLTTDLVLLVVDTPGSGVGRLAYLLVGAFVWGPGSGLYIGADLGPGPRDGLMTGLDARSLGSIRAVRTGIELSALTAGWLLGGSVGIGTVVVALTIGPNVRFFLPRLAAGARWRAATVQHLVTPAPAPAAD